MITAGVTIRADNSRAFAAAFRAAADQAVRKAAFDIEANAKVAAPVRTGFLKGSITAEGLTQSLWRVFVGAAYGPFVEYGTRYMAAQPFFWQAVDRVAPTLAADMRAIAKGQV